MKRYKVTFLRKKKKPEFVEAYGYTIKGSRCYFHMKPDLSDLSSFKPSVSSVSEVPIFRGEHDQVYLR